MSGGLEIRNLDGEVLRAVSLIVEAGQCVCLQGPSGAGKSLLLRAVADLDPHQGEVLLDGIPARHYTAPEWRSHVALVPSESAWWAEQVGDHFPEPAPQLLSRLGFPDDVSGWSVARLSSGERQRLALARALAKQPRALLLDEPTANLDVDNTHLVEQIVAEYRQQRRTPVLWVSHDPAQIERVSQATCRLDAGRLVSPCR